MTFEISNYFKKPPLWAYLVAYAIPYLSLAAIALYWPAHSSPWGLDFTQSPWARMVPSISAYIDKSSFPHATAAYFVFSGVFSILLFAFVTVFPGMLCFASDCMINGYKVFKKKRGIGWVILLLMFFAILYIMFIQPGYQFGIAPIRDSRWAMALVGVWSSFYFEVCIFALVIRVRYFYEKLFQLERKHHGME